MTPDEKFWQTLRDEIARKRAERVVAFNKIKGKAAGQVSDPEELAKTMATILVMEAHMRMQEDAGLIGLRLDPLPADELTSLLPQVPC
jgi:hypothetical protein